MKNLIRKVNVKKIFGMLNCLALFMSVAGVQQYCFWFWHQPDVPVEADKYRKFK